MLRDNERYNDFLKRLAEERKARNWKGHVYISENFNKPPTKKQKEALLLWGLGWTLSKAFQHSYGYVNNAYITAMRKSARMRYWRDKLVLEHMQALGRGPEEVVRIMLDFAEDVDHNSDETRMNMILQMAEMLGIKSQNKQYEIGMFMGNIDKLPRSKDVDEIEAKEVKQLEEQPDASKKQGAVQEDADTVSGGEDQREAAE